MSNGHLPNQWYEGEEVDMANNANDEKQTVLYLKRNGDGQAGIETILKRELQGMYFSLYLLKETCFIIGLYLIEICVYSLFCI